MFTVKGTVPLDRRIFQAGQKGPRSEAREGSRAEAYSFSTLTRIGPSATTQVGLFQRPAMEALT